MGLFWVLAAAAASKRTRTSHHRVKHDKKGYSTSGEYYSPNYSYYDCIQAELMTDDNLKSFFELLMTEYTKEKDYKKSIIIDEITTLKKEFEELKTEIGSASIRTSGIEVHYSGNYYGGYIYIKKDNEEISIPWEKEKTFEFLIEKLNKSKTSLEGVNEELMRLNDLLFSNKKRLKFSIFKRTELKSTIEKLNNEKTIYEEKRDSYIKTINALESIINLPEEDKNYISYVIDEMSKLYNLSREIELVRKKYQLFISKYENRKIDDELVKNIFDRLICEGKINQNDIERIFWVLDKVEIKGRRGEYNEQLYRVNKYESIRLFISWFVQNVYELDPDFVSRNYAIEEDSKELTRKKEE